MKWTHAQPIVEGLYYINHPTIQQTLLKLSHDGNDSNWDDPNNPRVGFKSLELPDDTLYAGPLESRPSLTWETP